MSEDAAQRRRDYATDGDYSGTWMVAHFLVFLALIDAFLFRNLLTPELLATESDITGQVRILFFWASLVVMPLMLIYAITKRSALARVRLYHLGAWIFFGLAVYLIVEDYKQYAEPGSFSARINLAIGRAENFIEPLIGFELSRL
jgi:hypothetical protein